MWSRARRGGLAEESDAGDGDGAAAVAGDFDTADVAIRNADLCDGVGQGGEEVVVVVVRTVMEGFLLEAARADGHDPP